MATSFVDLLKQSRSRPVSTFHKFLISYSPDNGRTHAFVEGTPDLAFYRNFLEQHVSGDGLRMYNCEGKANVYEAFAKVLGRFPRCRYVLFFVDKDLDDILGVPWPADPRIHVTDCYAVENYFASQEVVRRFFMDFVKIRRVDISLDAVLSEFTRRLQEFRRLILPTMAWIVMTRRAGHRPNLNDINPAEFLSFSASGIARRGSIRALEYLERVTQVQHQAGEWRQIRRTCQELRRLEPKRYVRGKFDAWFLLGFIRQTQEILGGIVRNAGGSISVSVQLTELNFIQLLLRGVQTPPPLESFLDFHFRPGADLSSRSTHTGILNQIKSWVSKLVD
jgi:hypothetical protein